MRSRWSALRGRAGLAEFSDAAAIDPQLQAFRRRVRVVPEGRLDKMAALITAGKTVISAPASRPLDDARLEAKLRELAGPRADAWLRFARLAGVDRQGGAALADGRYACAEERRMCAFLHLRTDLKRSLMNHLQHEVKNVQEGEPQLGGAGFTAGQMPGECRSASVQTGLFISGTPES